jgi:hypothetical protein
MTSPEQGAQHECSSTFAWFFGGINFSLLFKISVFKND